MNGILTDIKWQLCPVEKSIELKKLGASQESYWYWAVHKQTKNVHLQDAHSVLLPEVDYYSAYTLEELVIRIPNMIDGRRLTFSRRGHEGEGWVCWFDDVFPKANSPLIPETSGKNGSSALADMLAYVLTNKII